MNNQMNVCISADENFIELGAIVLQSIVTHANPATSFSFYIIDNGISETSYNRVLSMFEKETVTIEFINARDMERDIGMQIDGGRWPISAFQRLYIAEYLPQDVQRVLYLDCDILVRGPLDWLYEVDMEDRYVVAGAEECLSEQNKINIGITGQDIYVNSGVLLIDLERWRSLGIGRKSMEYIRENSQHLQFIDQDTINAVLKDRIKIVPLKYNAYTVLFNYTYNEMLQYRNVKEFCGQRMCQDAIDDPVIVHFTQDTISIRPWYKKGGHKYRKEWLEIRAMTPWKNQPLWEDNRPFGIKAKYAIFRILPRKIAVALAAKVNNRHAMNYSR